MPRDDPAERPRRTCDGDLLTDHRERETLTITDRSNIICDGRVIVSGDAQTVLNDPTAQEMYFGTRFDASSIIDEQSGFQKAA